MTNKGEILAKILNDFPNCYFFLHNTRDLQAVKKIMNEGFIFENQLTHSTDRINPLEPIEVVYFLLHRKEYGPYTVIISIPRVTYDFYTDISGKHSRTFEEVISINLPFYNDNDELTYILSQKHILGYFDNNSNEFFRNSNWDPFFINGISESDS